MGHESPFNAVFERRFNPRAGTNWKP